MSPVYFAPEFYLFQRVRGPTLRGSKQIFHERLSDDGTPITVPCTGINAAIRQRDRFAVGKFAGSVVYRGNGLRRRIHLQGRLNKSGGHHGPISIAIDRWITFWTCGLLESDR